jgi:hypothetical protein
VAIKLEFINFIVPIKIIKEKYSGGFEQCLKDHEKLIGGCVWYDEHLFRDGAMNPTDIGNIVNKWRYLGFHTHDGGDKPVKWIDVCVVEGLFGGTTLPCDWLEHHGSRIASLKNEPFGRIIGRDSFNDSS